MTQFNTDSYQGTVFSGCRKYQLTIAHYTPFQYWSTIRFNSKNARFRVFSSKVGDMRYEKGITIRFYARPKRLQVSFCSLRGR